MYMQEQCLQALGRDVTFNAICYSEQQNLKDLRVQQHRDCSMSGNLVGEVWCKTTAVPQL